MFAESVRLINLKNDFTFEMRWQTDFEVRSRDPLPTVIVILGFIATIFVGVPLYFTDEQVALYVYSFGIGMILIGILLWCVDR